MIFGHAGDAHVHVNPLVDVTRADWRARVAALLDEVTALVASLGGTLAGEHGDGRLRTPLLDRVWHADALAAVRGREARVRPRGHAQPRREGRRCAARRALGDVKYDPALAAARRRPRAPRSTASPSARAYAGASASTLLDARGRDRRVSRRVPAPLRQPAACSRRSCTTPSRRSPLLARPQFAEPEHLPVKWIGESTDGERLAEFAGRLCYMSQRNPASRTTRDYLENIKKQGHGSVLEHANYSLLLEGVSRSLTHELVRHRAGIAYSQLSQRYVDESEAQLRRAAGDRRRRGAGGGVARADRGGAERRTSRSSSS